MAPINLRIFHIMNDNGYRQLSGYKHSSKYLLLCSAEERNSFSVGFMWLLHY